MILNFVQDPVLLGRVALIAQRPIVIELSRERSVGLSVCPVASALWKNGGSDLDAVWHCRSDGSVDEAGGVVWRSVHRKGYFWGLNLGRAIVHSGRPTCATAPRRGPLAKLLWADLLLLLLLFHKLCGCLQRTWC